MTIKVKPGRYKKYPYMDTFKRYNPEDGILYNDDEEKVEITSQFYNNQNIDTLVLGDGSKLRIGDTLIFGSPMNNSKEYLNVVFGKYNLAKAVLIGPPQHMADGWQGNKIVITNINNDITTIQFAIVLKNYLVKRGIKVNSAKSVRKEERIFQKYRLAIRPQKYFKDLDMMNERMNQSLRLDLRGTERISLLCDSPLFSVGFTSRESISRSSQTCSSSFRCPCIGSTRCFSCIARRLR
jgi:hypothetical protein